MWKEGGGCLVGVLVLKIIRHSIAFCYNGELISITMIK